MKAAVLWVVVAAVVPWRDGATLSGLDSAPVTATCPNGSALRGVQGGAAQCVAIDLAIPATKRETFVSPGDFEPSLDATTNITPWESDYTFIRRRSNSVATMRADIHLPEGAVFDSVSCRVFDDVVGDDDTTSLQWWVALANEGIAGVACHPLMRSPTGTTGSVMTVLASQLTDSNCLLPLSGAAVVGVRTFKLNVSSQAAYAGVSTSPEGVGLFGCTVRYQTTAVAP